MSPKDVRPVSRKTDLVVQDFGKEILVYDLTENKAFSLNEASAMVWQICDGHKSISDIAKILSEKYGSVVSEDFVWLALDQLKNQNLLEDAGEISTDSNGLSRREVIRKIGFASLIALPLISTLIVPEAAHAASGTCTTGANGRGLNCPCTAITQCQPPTNRCCVSSAPAPTSGTCQPNNVAVDLTGVCGNSCTCISNCCASGTCVAFRTQATSTACTTSCQCSSGTCNAGFCT